MTQRVIALLGRKDEPTDAVEEYCRHLASALYTHEIEIEIHRVPWELRGWPKAIHDLKSRAGEWRGTWVLIQYTALAWSARGFPQKILHVLRKLKFAGARVGVVFHDVEPYPGARVIDRLRRIVQVRTMRRVLAHADLAIFTVPPAQLSWRPASTPQAVFIPVGPNLPILVEPLANAARSSLPTIGVFSITGGDSGAREAQHIIGAVRYASQKIGKLRLSVFGRHAELREAALRDGLRALPVELSVEGVVDPEKVVWRLCACDVLLFVRGNISSRRSSAIAGIACGLPVIAFSGSETAPPVIDAGVILVPPDQPVLLGDALVRVLTDDAVRADLASRSRGAFQLHFSWPAIAARFASVLQVK